MGTYSLTGSCDDFPVKARLNEECMNEFRDKVLSLRMGYDTLSRNEFFRRTYAYSGKYLTFAGALMFGGIIRVIVRMNDIKIDAHNIWRAYTDILPRMTHELTHNCAIAFREAFINALLHSDYSISRSITVTIKPRPLRAIITNPGTITGTIRNHRLMKMFVLSGISSCNHGGIKRIRNYEPEFELEGDTRNIRTRAVIHLKGIESLPKIIML